MDSYWTQPPAGLPSRNPVTPSPPPQANPTALPPSPTDSTVQSVSTVTTRFSQDSKTSSRFESTATSSPRSLIPPPEDTPCFDSGFRSLQQSPPPVGDAAPPGTPPRGPPAVTSTQPTPPRPHRGRADRSPSPDRPTSRAMLQPHQVQHRHLSPGPKHARGRSLSAQPPPVRGVSTDAPRAVSGPLSGLPPSAPTSSQGSPPVIAADKKKPRKSWFPGSRSRASSGAGKPRSAAWILTDPPVDYNTTPLVQGEKVPELWNEAGNVYIYVHPKESGQGPCFKVADNIFSNSSVLIELLVAEMMATSNLGGAPQAGPVTEGHLYLPLGNTDLERLIAARNLFAFLTHQPLVATPENPTLFAAILQVAGLLRRFNFSSPDGSSFGEHVDVAFDVLCETSGIADVRQSREKTLEALILAEQMKSWNLYNEAFAHAVGKYESLLELKSPLFERISTSTRQRLDRAYLDLKSRQTSVNTRLEAFEFPSLFSGIANSTSTEEYRHVRFKEWRTSFGKMRSFVLGYYKTLFGHWPPRARSKKNYFSQSGLNRQCLKILYSDFCALYDLLVDRQSMTPRIIGEKAEASQDKKNKEKEGEDSQQDERKLAEAYISALRRVLDEFDKSSPPVLPPIPFDVPKLPSMTAIYENYHDLPAKKQAKYSKALQPHETQLILIKSRNLDTDALKLPFLDAYKEFEIREAKGGLPNDLLDQRIGHWLFLYVVIQSLPMLVIDAPGLRYTEGVEDFLCEAPQGNPPWTEDAGATRKMWFQTNDSAVVELSADVVMFSVEGIYMRSHCWLAAKEWEASGGASATGPGSSAAAILGADGVSAPLQPPHPAFRDMEPYPPGPGSGTDSANHRRSQSPTSLQQQLQQPGSRAGTPPITASAAAAAAATLSPPTLPASRPSSRPSSPHLRPTLAPSASSPHLRPRSSSVNERARQAMRTSIAIGLEPLPMPAGLAPLDPGYHRTSRVVSVGSPGSPGVDSPTGGSSGGAPSPPLLVAPGHGQLGVPDQQQQQGPTLRMSRSAACLNPGAAGGGEFVPYKPGAGAGTHMRTSSYGSFVGANVVPPNGHGGGAFGHASHGSLGSLGQLHHHLHLGPHHHYQHQQSPLSVSTSVGGPVGGQQGAGGGAATDSPVGGSTFDDILKGMDGKEKKKKKLFLI
ncbi:hypothetical protein VTJ04DRAFT_1047 [Mycothermus thermophilus]|uniref:uncharacterized protein n=1 Tax=Humicola insolens TaxID=85995 RepID=UPI003744295E